MKNTAIEMNSEKIAKQWRELTQNIAVYGNVVTPDQTRRALEVLLEERGWDVPVQVVELEPINGQTRHALIQVGTEKIEVRFQGDGGFSHAMLPTQSSMYGLKRKGELRRLYSDDEGISPELLGLLFRAAPNSTEEQWKYILAVVADAPRQSETPSYWYELNSKALKKWAAGKHTHFNVEPLGFN